MIPSAESDSSTNDDGAALVKEVLEENPPVTRGVREEWRRHSGWHRREDVHAKTDEAPSSELEEALDLHIPISTAPAVNTHENLQDLSTATVAITSTPPIAGGRTNKPLGESVYTTEEGVFRRTGLRRRNSKVQSSSKPSAKTEGTDHERLEPVKIASVVGIAAILATLMFTLMLILPRSMRRKVKRLFRISPTEACLPISSSKKRAR